MQGVKLDVASLKKTLNANFLSLIVSDEVRGQSTGLLSSAVAVYHDTKIRNLTKVDKCKITE